MPIARLRYLWAVSALTAPLLLLIVPAPVTARVAQSTPQVVREEKHVNGQSVAPVFEGWEPNPDGTFGLYFGYMNRNWQEEVDIPIGPDNSFEPGPDRGQPAHFLPRRHKNVFRVVVPKDFGDKKIVWTLLSRGQTAKVPGSLNPFYQIDVSRRPDTGNMPPVVTVTPDNPTITLSDTLALTASVTDDGLPKRRESAKDDPRWRPPDHPDALLTVEWSKYRGPGTVTFAPDKQEVVNYGKATTRATFSAPGTYVLQVVVPDGSWYGFSCCWTNAEVKVIVKPAAGAAGRR